MKEAPFTNREITAMFKEQSAELKAHMDARLIPLTDEVRYTNGKLRKVIIVLIIVASVTATLLVVNGSEFANFILKVI